MYLQISTRYFPLSIGMMMSCILSSTSWLGSESGSPFLSWVYPNSFSFSIDVPIHFGLKWVRGEFVASKRTVPSLKTVNP